MSDIVERLRSVSISSNTQDFLGFPFNEAADEIESLRSRLAEAEALLRENVGYEPMPLGWFERVRAFLAADSASGDQG